MAAINLTTGTAGIKPKDYRVYIDSDTESGSAMDTFMAIANPTKANVITLLGALRELGECRADSIDLGIDDGDSVEGNTLGKIVLDKTGTFTVELINATPANIAALETIDGVSCNIVLVEKETHGASLKTVVAMANVVVSYTEKLTGGDSIRSTLNVEKSVPNASSFRKIVDVSYV